jgi:FkbM family methyltransferase
VTPVLVNFQKTYRFLAGLRNSYIPGKGTLSRFLSKRLIPEPEGKVICKTLYGFDLLINPKIDTGVEHSLYYFGTYEEGTLDFIISRLKPGDIFFDIGANIGLMSIVAAKSVGEKGKVYAFEANPETEKILRSNVELNHIDNIICINKAVGNSNGRINIYDNWEVNRGGSTLIKPSNEARSFEVELISIDSHDAYAQLPVRMVKIDVEGFEMDVLKGMEKMLTRQNAPDLIVECSAGRNNNYESVNEIFHFIKKTGRYKFYKLSRTKERKGKLTELMSEKELPAHDNIFCLNPQA